MSYESLNGAACGNHLLFMDPYRRHLYVQFYAFINEMSQNFSLTYDTEDVYGRNDSIFSYKNTKRSISLNWSVPSESLVEAKMNRLKTRLLIRMLYPTYQNLRKHSMKDAEIAAIIKKKNVNAPEATPGGITTYEEYMLYKEFVEASSLDYPTGYDVLATNVKGVDASTTSTEVMTDTGFHHTQTMIQNPIIEVKFANLLSHADGRKGLVGYLDGLSVKPVIEEGYYTECAGKFYNKFTKRTTSYPAGTYPKMYSLSCNFNVLHEHSLGFQRGERLYPRIFAGIDAPYGE